MSTAEGHPTDKALGGVSIGFFGGLNFIRPFKEPRMSEAHRVLYQDLLSCPCAPTCSRAGAGRWRRHAPDLAVTPTVRQQINAGQVQYVDFHRLHAAQLVRFGFSGTLDLAVGETSTPRDCAPTRLVRHSEHVSGGRVAKAAMQGPDLETMALFSAHRLALHHVNSQCAVPPYYRLTQDTHHAHLEKARRPERIERLK